MPTTARTPRFARARAAGPALWRRHSRRPHVVRAGARRADHGAVIADASPPTRGKRSPGAPGPRARSPRTSTPSARGTPEGRGERWLLCERRRRRRAQVLSAQSAADRDAERAGGARAQPLADRAAVSRAQRRPRARSLRRPHLSRLDAPRRPHRRRVHLPAARTRAAPAPRRRPTLPVSAAGSARSWACSTSSTPPAARHARQLSAQSAATKVTK